MVTDYLDLITRSDKIKKIYWVILVEGINGRMEGDKYLSSTRLPYWLLQTGGRN